MSSKASALHSNVVEARSPAGDSGLTLRPLRGEAGELRALQACFERNGDRRRSLAALRWLYCAGPGQGPLWVDVAWSSEQQRIAAVYASVPVPVRVEEGTVLCAQSLDTLTDADFRGRGLFKRLANRVYERAAEEGCAAVYGFPNRNSAPGFFAKLGWAQLDPVPLLMRPLRPRYFARQSAWLRSHLDPLLKRLPDPPLPAVRLPKPPGLRWAGIERFDERADDLWHAMAAGFVGVERGAAYLNWRLREKPGESYRTLALHRADGRLEAVCSFCLKAKHGGNIAYIMELLHRPGAPYAGASVLSQALAEVSAQGADAALAWAMPHSPNRASFRLNGFFDVPQGLRPIELHFGVRALSAQHPGLRARERWYLSYLDSDTV